MAPSTNSRSDLKVVGIACKKPFFWVGGTFCLLYSGVDIVRSQCGVLKGLKGWVTCHTMSKGEEAGCGNVFDGCVR